MILRLRGARSFQRQVATAGAELEALGVKGARSMSSFAAQAGRLKSVGRSMTTGMTLPIVGLGYAAGKVAIDFDKSMRNVNSIAQLSEGQFASLSDQVRGLAGPTAQSPVTLAEGLYDLVSSGFDAAESMKILEASANAATAGLTTTDVSTKAVAAVLNAYRLPADQANKVSDQLFKTVDRGVISFEDLANNIGDVLPFASSLNVGLDEVGASIATMTKAGISPSETMTRIKAVMTTMLKPGTDLANTLEDLGYKSGEAMIHALGFQGSLDALAKATGGSKEELAKLFPNVRALGGALALTGENSKSANQDLKGMRDAGGATATALSQQSKSISFQWNKLKATAEALAIQIGPPLLGGFRAIMGVASKLVGFFSKLPPSVQEATVVFLFLAAAAGPLVWALGGVAQGVGAVVLFLPRLIAFATGFSALAQGVGVLNALKIALVGFGLTLKGVMITTGIGAVIAAIVLLDQKFHFLGPTLDWLKGAANATWKGIQAGLRWLVQAAKDAWNAIKGPAAVLWKVIKLWATPVLLWLRLQFEIIKRVGGAVWGFIKDNAGPVLNWLKGAAEGAIDHIKDMAHGIASVYTGIFNAIKGPIVSIINFVIDRINDLIDAHNALPFVGDIGHISNISDSIEGPSPKGGGPGAFDVFPGGGGSGGSGGGGSSRPRTKVNPIAGVSRAGGGAERPIHHTTVLQLNGREIARETVRNLETAAARA